MAYTRDEMEAALRHYQAVAAEAGRSGEWQPFVDLFTDDVHYVEHLYGTFEGKDAVAGWVVPEMTKWPITEMREYPWDWYVIDEERGWIVGQIANVMTDPGDGKEYRAVNWTRLVYAGNGLFSEEEDIYNPSEFASVVGDWIKAYRDHHDS